VIRSGPGNVGFRTHAAQAFPVSNVAFRTGISTLHLLNYRLVYLLVNQAAGISTIIVVMDNMNLTAPATTPAMAPPPGVTPNFVNGESLLTIAVVTVGLCMFSITLALVLRLFTKIFIAKSMGWDDCECSPFMMPSES
jgi:hypothetical protein